MLLQMPVWIARRIYRANHRRKNLEARDPEGVRRCARNCRKIFAIFRQLREFSMPSKGAHLPSVERSRGGVGFPRTKDFASTYEAEARFKSDIEMSEDLHDLPTVTRSSPNPSTGPLSSTRCATSIKDEASALCK